MHPPLNDQYTQSKYPSWVIYFQITTQYDIHPQLDTFSPNEPLNLLIFFVIISKIIWRLHPGWILLQINRFNLLHHSLYIIGANNKVIKMYADILVMFPIFINPNTNITIKTILTKNKRVYGIWNMVMKPFTNVT